MTLSSVLLFPKEDRAFAAVEKTTVLKEDFNKNALGEEWINHGAKLDKDYDAMRFNGNFNYGGTVSPAGFKFGGSCELHFKVKAISGTWFAMGFGGRESLTTYAEYSFSLSFGIKSTTASQGNGAFTYEKVGQSDDAYFLEYAKTRPVEVVIKLEEVSLKPHLYNVTAAFYDAETQARVGEEFYCEGLEELGGYEYVCFNTGDSLLDILSFEAIRGGETVFSDGFSLPSIAYGGDNGETKWTTNKNYGEENVYIAPISSLDFSGGNAFAIFSEKMPESNNYVEKTYEISFKASFGAKGFSEAVMFGIGFDLAPNSERLDENKMAGFVLSDGEIRPATMSERKIKYLSGGYKPSDVYGREFSVTVTALSDGSVKIKLGAKEFTFNNVSSGGLFGIGCQNVSDERKNEIKIDDVSVEVYGAKISSAADVSTDFTGVKTTVDTDGTVYYDYYLNETKWYLGTNVKLLPYNPSWPSDYLSFTNSTNYSAFGPKEKYGEYIIQCDITINSVGANNQMIGLSFGRNAYSMTTQFTTAVGFYMQVQGGYNRTIIYTYNCKLEGGSGDKTLYKENGSEEYMWATRDENKKLVTERYNIMFVVKNRSVTVHYKRAEEDVSVLGKVRARVTDVNTFGYPAIFGLGGVSFEMRNFRLMNIDPLAEG